MKKIYKCEICGNVAEKLFDSGVDMICCGKPMNELKEKTQDLGKEKHVPIVEKTENGILVVVGAVPHPMQEEHWIEWIEVVSKDESFIKFLKPGMKPEAEFCVENYDVVRIYCNIHGLWKGK